MAPVTATGVPKPAAPSKNAPKLNATSSSCRRRSSVMPEIELCNTLNDPFKVVSRCRKMMLRTIQPIGNRPETMPRPAALLAIAVGMPNTNEAIPTPTISARPAARCACIWKNASEHSSTATGIPAAMVDHTALPSGS